MPDDDTSAFDDFRATGSEHAFRRVVEAFLPLVWSAALRVAGGDAALAQDVAQLVFVDLARKGRSLPPGVRLAGWLHRHTTFTASKAVRGEVRRRRREQEAAAMTAGDPETHPWQHLTPHLDAALNELPAADRQALLLRFFEKQDLRSVGHALGLSEEAARKRITRALEKLRTRLGRRGAKVGAAALAACLTAEGVTAPPAGLAAALATTSWAGAGTSAGAAASGFAALVLRLGWRKLAAAAAAALVIAGAAVWGLAHLLGGGKSGTAAGPPVTLSPAPRPPRAGLPAATGQWRVRTEIFTLPEADWADRLRHRSADDAALLTAVRAAATDPPEPLDLIVDEGKRAKFERITETPYPTEFDFEEDGTPVHSSFETKNVGTTVEIDLSRADPGRPHAVEFAVDHHLAPPTWQLWPVDTALGAGKGEIGLKQPNFHVLSSHATLLISSGQTRMAATCLIPRSADPENTGPPRRAFVFLTLLPNQ